MLFADTFNRWFEPENLRAALRVLTAAGYRVRMPKYRGRPLCCGRSYLAVGMVDKARSRGTPHARHPRRRPAGDRPGAVLPADLRDEYRSLLPGAEAQALADRALLLSEFLAREKPELTLKPMPATAFVHGHCHQKSFGAFPTALAMLQTHPGAHGEADRIVLLRHGRLIRLSGGNAGRCRAPWPRPACCRRCAAPRPRTSSSPTAPRAGTRSAISAAARRSIPFGCSNRRGMMTQDDVLDFWFAGDPRRIARSGSRRPPNSTPPAHASPTRCRRARRARSITGPKRPAAHWR